MDDASSRAVPPRGSTINGVWRALPPRVGPRWHGGPGHPARTQAEEMQGLGTASGVRREASHACKAWALTRQGQVGAACKRKDRKSGQRRESAWPEKRSKGEEMELEKRRACPSGAKWCCESPGWATSDCPLLACASCPNPATSPVPPWDGCPPAGTRWWDPPRLHPQGTIPAWLLTCTRSSPQGPGAAPSQARCTAETAAGWTCCCRCSLGMAWRKRWH